MIRLRDSGMFILHLRRPKIINGVYRLPKEEGKLRPINGSLNENMSLKPPKDYLLSTGGKEELLMESQSPLYVAKSILDNNYHWLSVPNSMFTYFGLPAIKINEEKIFPM